jgi:hypothetical protein
MLTPKEIGAAGGVFPYPIDYSALFDGSTDYLSRTPSVAGNQQVCTVSLHIKAGNKASFPFVFSAGADAGNRTYLFFNNDGALIFRSATGGVNKCVKQTSALFVDETAHYHIVISIDTLNETAEDRFIMWVNGDRITEWSSSTDFGLGNTTSLTNTVNHTIGTSSYSPSTYLSAYISDFYLVDGQALPASTWGEASNLVTGLWIPKAPGTLTYGTNGCRLDFANAIALGADASGNGNDWTVNGSPVQTLDTPTNNYCTLNAVDHLTTGTLSNGNLTVASGNATVTYRPSSGQWYYEKDGVGVSYDADVSGQFNPTLTAGTYNFGATAWADTGPTGTEKAINAQNIYAASPPTILKSSTVADIVLREGTGAEAALILEFQPDFVNTKDRDNARSWALSDSVNGVTKYLSTDTTAALATDVQSLKSFDTLGYTLGTSGVMNHSGASFIDLCIKAGVDQGLSIQANINHTNGVATAIAHGLGSVVTWGMIRRTDSTGDWWIFAGPLGVNYYGKFTTAAFVNSAGFWSTNTSTTFDIPASLATGTYVAYLFTDSDIFKAFNYTGNASVDGPFVNLGGKVLSIPFLKNSGAVYNWVNFDARREPFNSINLDLRPNLANAEDTTSFANFVSQGFKVTAAGNTINGSGNLHVGLAILESTIFNNAY